MSGICLERLNEIRAPGRFELIWHALTRIVSFFCGYFSVLGSSLGRVAEKRKKNCVEIFKIIFILFIFA
jgi:hypothetical protein